MLDSSPHRPYNRPMINSKPAILTILLLPVLFGFLAAADKAYRIIELRPAGSGVELILRDLENEDKLLQLVVYDKDRLVDLAAAEEIPATRARQGDILFLGGSGKKATQMIITPGRTVHPRLAAGQAEETKIIDALSRKLAAGPRAPSADAARAPAADSELDRVRRSFLFVLEFALGAPFTAAQERLILGQFSSAWWSGKSAGERKSFGQYPEVVAWIMKAGRKDLEEMRGSLEETTRQWLRESPASDPVVAMVRARLAERGRTLAAGDPPLTEMAASAFCELTAYSRLLRRNGAALPAQLDDAEVAGVRTELLRAWPGFSASEKAQVATAPGLWLVLRTLVGHGDADQRRHAIGRLLSLTAAEAQPGAAAGKGRAGKRGKGGDAVGNMIRHNVMMNIRQQTFNTYMWSRGFNYHPTYGKMW